jgi:hypothetical protein
MFVAGPRKIPAQTASSRWRKTRIALTTSPVRVLLDIRIPPEASAAAINRETLAADDEQERCCGGQ